MDKPAQWAMVLAHQLMTNETHSPYWTAAFARYIEAHETPRVVDPLLIEAREAAAQAVNLDHPEYYTTGLHDSHVVVQSALIALQRRERGE